MLPLPGNFFRIRSAFAFGAKRLARLLYCSKEEIVFELNQFFMNTWERHGSGIRPDAPACVFWHLIPSNISQSQAVNNYMSVPSSKKNNRRPSAHESLVEKASRDRQSSGARRSNYHYDRNNQRGEREGNWNTSKSRAASRNHIRNQADTPSSRIDRLSSNENWAERPWSSPSHDSLPPYQSQNGPLHPSSSPSSSANVPYGMHPLLGVNPGSVGSNGPMVPSVVMFYPCDNSSSYGGSPDEPLEFGYVGPMGFIGSNEVSHVMEGVRARGAIEEQRFHGSSQISSPDQPSSPHFQRKNDPMKGEDFTCQTSWEEVTGKNLQRDKPAHQWLHTPMDERGFFMA